MSCILCGNTPNHLFDIKDYTRDDIVEIFGARNEMCIAEDQSICKPCQKTLEKLAQLKRRLRYLILRPSEDRKPVDLTHIWKLFASFQLDKEDKEKRSIPTPNPSVLFTISDCENFSEIHPGASKRKPRRRKSEKRGHGWTRRKRSASSASVTTRASTRASTRANSRGSTRTSIATPFSTLSGFSRANTPYTDISNLTSVTRRSRRRAAAAEVEKQSVLKETFDSNILYCPDKKCSLYYMNVDLLNYHIKLHHKTPQLFNCTECTASFSVEEHLKIHSKIHDFSPFFCLMCAAPQENRVQLQNHLEQHMIYSVPCTYCDKSFLTEDQLKSHHKYEHYKARKQKVLSQKRPICKKIIYKKSNPESNNNEGITNDQNSIGDNQENISEENTIQRIEQQEAITDNGRLRNFFRKEYNVRLVPQLHEVTVENLMFEHIELYTGDGYEDAEDRIHMETEEDENTTTDDENGNLRADLESIIAENGSDIDRSEEIEARDANDIQDEQGIPSDNINVSDESSTTQPLVNGFGDGSGTEAMDVGSDEENHRSQQNPS